MKKKRLIWTIVIVIVVLLIAVLVKGRGSDEMRVTTAEVKERTLIETVIANGKIQPETEVIISSEVSGKILALPFKEGSKVSKGDLLVKINPDLAQAAMDRSEASLNNARANKASADARALQAEAQLRNNQTMMDRNERLLKEGAISQAEYENVLANYETAQAEVMAANESSKAASYMVQSAVASVKEAKDSYSRTTIYAPMDGTISSLSVEEGEQVVGAMQMTGTEIMRVANLDVMEVLAEVNESDIVRVMQNDTAMVEVDAYLDRQFKGIVTEIANSANNTGMSTDQVTNFEVKVRILRSSYEDLLTEANANLSPFRPGMNATVDITTSTTENAISVPIECVTSRADTTSGPRTSVERIMGKSDTENEEPVTCVFVIENGKVKIVPVTTGVQDDKYIEITEGLESETEVVSGPFELVSKRLVNGDKVEVVSKSKLYEKK